MHDKSLFRNLAVAAVAGWLSIFVILPNLLSLCVSFLSSGETEFATTPVTLSNFAALAEPDFLRMFLDSVWLALGTALFCLVIGYPFAYILARLTPKKRNLGLLLVIIPFWTNSLIRTYALITILNVNGLLNKSLLALRLIERPLDILYTDAAVFIGLTYTLLPFMILPLYASIEKLDQGLIEAARDLGAGSLQTFLRIGLPLTLPGVMAGTMLVFLPALGMFYVPDVLGGAKSLLVGNFIRNQFLTAHNWPLGSAASVLLTLLMALLLLARHLSNRRVRREAAA